MYQFYAKVVPTLYVFIDKVMLFSTVFFLWKKTALEHNYNFIVFREAVFSVKKINFNKNRKNFRRKYSLISSA